MRERKMFEGFIAITSLAVIILFGLVYDSWHGTAPRDKGSDDD